MVAIAAIAEHSVTRGQHYYGPGERGNECARDVDSRISSRGKVVEERARDHGAHDTQPEVQHHALTGTLKEPARDVAGAKSEQDEDNDGHRNLADVSRLLGATKVSSSDRARLAGLEQLCLCDNVPTTALTRWLTR